MHLRRFLIPYHNVKMSNVCEMSNMLHIAFRIIREYCLLHHNVNKVQLYEVSNVSHIAV